MSDHSGSGPSLALAPVPATIKTTTSLVALSLPLLALFCLLAPSLFAQTPTAVPVLTWRYDNTHAGQNTNETALTPANVNTTTFGKLFSVTVDSTVYAQPLYVPALTMSDGKVHNVLFVSTENDSIYAFDADSNGGANASPIWKITLTDAAHGAGAGATAVNYKGTVIGNQGDIGPTIGITGTPAINSATNTMYVVSNTEESGAFFSRLHAINIITGAEQSSPTVAQSPVVISATVAGTGTASSGGKLAFDPLVSNQRPALDFYNGYVYIGYAAHGDIGPWHGWLFAYNATTMAQSAALCLSPNGAGAGIWASGAGLPIDDDATGGRMFVVSGNNGVQNDQDTLTNYPPFANAQLGESILDFSLANGGLTPTDAFTSFNAKTLDGSDWDQGSGGILMVPDQEGTNPHILVTAGKEGRILVLNRDNLGGNNAGAASNTGALQDITGVMTGGDGLWSTPAYWNGNVYLWPNKGVPMIFSLTDGVLSTTPTSTAPASTFKPGLIFPEPSFSVSSNGTQDGIAWAVLSDLFNTYGPAVLYAWPANSLATPLYESDTNAARDSAGPANKFSIPIVTNGKVYVATHGQVDVYGLFNGEESAAAPVITPNGGTFAASTSVTLTTTTSSAQIYYTLDGSTPTPASTLYAGPINIATDTTLRAIASAAGFIQSPISSAIFNFSDQTPLISFSPAAGTYAGPQQVTLSDADANAKIYYTLDGSTPSASSTLYTGPIKVAISETINAIAIDPSLTNSDIGTAAYVIQAGGTTINFGGGFNSTAGLTLNGSAVATNDTRLQLTDAGLNEAGSVFWNTPINIQAFNTVFTFQLSDAQANGFTFTIQNVGPTALGGDSAGLGYSGIGAALGNSVAVKFNFYAIDGEGNDSTGVYTGGKLPTLPEVNIAPSGIELNSDDAIQATINYDGTTLTLTLLDQVINKTFTMSQAINIQQVVGGNTAYVGFTGADGGLSASQKLASWTYTTEAVGPAFAPVAGTYAAPQNVALSSATTDAMIYYTTNGTTPTAASTQYSSPIAVDASEKLEAIAISPTLGTSNVESAAYVIQTPVPATFALSGTAISIASPGAAGNSTITITPSGGFTGTVAITCAVTSSPSGAIDPPTCSATQPSAITGGTAATSTLSVNTTAASTAALHIPLERIFTLGGGGTLAALLLFGLPFRRRKWQMLFSLLVFLAIASAAIGCGGPSVTTKQPSGGTTAGSYTVTVTGTSGSTKATTAVAVTVE